ncbi:MAG: endolytic transglycosylase MltG [Bacteroidota bacterium]
MKKVLIGLAVLIFLALSAAGVVYFYAQGELDKQIPANKDVILKIPRNSSLPKIINILNDKGIYQPGWMYEGIAKIYSKLNDKHIQAGYYKFPHYLTNRQLLDALFAGEYLYTVSVTFPEGLRMRDFASIAAKNLEVDSAEFMQICRTHPIIDEWGISAGNLEGYLLPDTYRFFPDADARAVVDRFVDAQKKFWTNERMAIASANDMTRHEIITLASIVEAEASVPDERRRISGVYHNRLDRGMLLQADPTVQFAIGEKRRVLYRDLEARHPYNTYVNSGLPPGPINNPGRSSILATLNPEQHDYLFFVAVGDGTGWHNFSRNMSGHAENVTEYRRNVRERRSN